ncbi:hypothetical protein GTP44_13435 [Duganella sp. FT50W]|uniref:Uncharacterized protein n=1 Tax=Duganella lactea TaxID=2692173 RepID=A0A6L8MM97_9BURK|nr:hypothetical protein [Duganella lactea]MYM82956.1 hypothetical protein [Duganella lactea]
MKSTSLLLLTLLQLPTAATAQEPVVEVEEEIYAYVPANNGATPMWDSGSSNLVRIGEQVFASGLDTLPGMAPPNNTQCRLWRRSSLGWRADPPDPSGRTREPCPLVAFPDRRQIMLSANPVRDDTPGAPAGATNPVIRQYTARGKMRNPTAIQPRWQARDPAPVFSAISYRSFAGDGMNNEMILFQNIEYDHAEWAFRDKQGHWNAQGRLSWPLDAERSGNPPIRLCYPNVALDKRSVHFVGTDDVVEPNPGWRLAKRDLTGNTWDYVTRRLYYAWTSDITQQPFSAWLELANRDRTAGRVIPGDLWLAPDGSAHIAWEETAIDMRLRDKFFPDEKQRYELNYAVVRDGKLVSKTTLLATDEGKQGPVPHLPRFQHTQQGRLFVFFYVNGTDPSGKGLRENRLIEILPDGTAGPMLHVPLKHPLNNYMTATERAGSAPSDTLDVIGTEPSNAPTIRYARIRLPGTPSDGEAEGR